MIESAKTSKDNLIDVDVLAKLGGVLGLLTAVITSVLQIIELVQNPKALRIASIAGFTVFILVALWFASLKARNPCRRWLILVMLYVFTALYFTWVGTWLIVPAPRPIVIDDMTAVPIWSTSEYGGSSLTVHKVTGRTRTTHALALDYTLEKDGWVSVHREISPAALANTRAIGFYFKGSGAPNTLELKLVRKPDAKGQSAIFGVIWGHATATDEWRYLEAPYSLFVCWRETGCEPGAVLDPNEVWKIDIAISNKAGDTPGSGAVLIGPILGIPRSHTTE